MTDPWHVAALYRFAPLPDYRSLVAPLRGMCELLDVKGTLLLASEGINGTVAGTRDSLDALLGFLCADPRISELDVKWSTSATEPFHRLKVRPKREIVTLGIDGVDPRETVGTYVGAEDWNAVLSDPDAVVIDTRNRFEVALGTFRGAVDPGTDSFTDFPAWAEANRGRLQSASQVAMFCTGGIRCEKASSWMQREGFGEVKHLQGGILRYLEAVPEAESLWNGSCFVFDNRIGVGHGVRESDDVTLCYNCRTPLTSEDRENPAFEEGVSCAICAPELTDVRLRTLRERQRQVKLAESRGQRHIGRKA